MRKLLVPSDVFNELRRLILETPDGLESGVTLFGKRVPPSSATTPTKGSNANSPAHVPADVVLAVAGPGKRATHEPAYYSGDENHSNEIFAALRCALPDIEWLGEVHVHPRGMTRLSRHDLRTIQQILTGQDATLHPEEFIAGVMQRRNGSVDIYPRHFTRACLQGDVMELQVVESNAPIVYRARLRGVENARPNLCTKSQGSRTAQPQAPRHRRVRQCWKRLGGYGHSLWLRIVHLSRSRNART